jgi:hypothetical protein
VLNTLLTDVAKCRQIQDVTIPAGVGVAQSAQYLGYGVDGWCSSPGRGGEEISSSLAHLDWAHPASYPMGTGGYFPRAKVAGA